LTVERPALRRGNAARAASTWEHRWGETLPSRQAPAGGQVRAGLGVSGG